MGKVRGDIISIKVMDISHQVIWKKKVNLLDEKELAFLLLDLQKYCDVKQLIYRYEYQYNKEMATHNKDEQTIEWN